MAKPRRRVGRGHEPRNESRGSRAAQFSRTAPSLRGGALRAGTLASRATTQYIGEVVPDPIVSTPAAWGPGSVAAASRLAVPASPRSPLRRDADDAREAALT